MLCFHKSCGSGDDALKPVSELSINLLDGNLFPLNAEQKSADSTGFILQYKVQSEDCLCHCTPILACDCSSPLMASVNGKEVRPYDGLHCLGGNDRCFVVSSFMHEGGNVIELSGRGEEPKAFISGDFNVEYRSGEGWVIAPQKKPELGSLANQGLPFYQGGVAYTKVFEAKRSLGRRMLCIPDWAGASCQVWINDIKVADVCSKPFKKNIGKYIKSGENVIEVRISGSSEKPATSDFGLLEEFYIN